MGLEMSDDGALEVARVRAVRHVLPTVCCVECVISPSEARWHHLGRYRCSGAGYVDVDAEGFDYMDRKLLLAVIDSSLVGR